MKKLMVLVMMLLMIPLASCQEANLITLTPKNTVNLRGAIDASSVQVVMDNIIKLRANSSETIYLVINSPGGEIGAGNDLITFLEGQKNIKTITIFAASMAAAVVEINEGERLMTNNGILMFHRAAGGVEGQFDGELESRLEFFKKILENLEVKQAMRMKMSIQDFKNKLINEYWIPGFEALRKNAADKIIKIQCSADLVKEKDISEIHFFGMSVKIEFNRCPLYNAPKLVRDEGKDMGK